VLRWQRRRFRRGELLKLGIKAPPPSQTWRTFLTNHVRDLVSIGLTQLPRFQGQGADISTGYDGVE